MRRSGKSRGFTLIELLVVIAIIALLVSILVPTVAKAREMAKAIPCKANLKGMGTAIQQYVGDNSEHVPPFFVLAGRTPWSMLYWDDVLVRYFDTDAVAHKPGDLSDVPNSPGCQPANGDYYKPINTGYGYVRYSKRMDCPAQKNRNWYEYSWNATYWGKPSYWRANFTTLPSSSWNISTWGFEPVKIGTYRPSEFAAIVETNPQDLSGGYPWPQFVSNSSGHMNLWAKASPHMSRTNMAMLDGRVSEVPAVFFLDYYNSTQHHYPFTIPGY